MLELSYIFLCPYIYIPDDNSIMMVKNLHCRFGLDSSGIFSQATLHCMIGPHTIPYVRRRGSCCADVVYNLQSTTLDYYCDQYIFIVYNKSH